MQLFDYASRGPLGALQLIASVRMQAIWAVLGSILTILAIAMEPFTQQILSFPMSTMVSNDTTAGIASSRVVGGSGEINYRSGHPWSFLSFTRTSYIYRLGSAIASGAVGDIPPAHFTCPSGDCSWPEFKTLGFCNRCEDISDRVIASPVTKLGYENISRSITYSLHDQHSLEQGSVRLTTTFANYYNAAIVPEPQLAISSSPIGWYDTSSTLAKDPLSRTTILNILTLRLNAYYPWNRSLNAAYYSRNGSTSDTLGEIIRPQALNCSLTFCQQTHAETRYAHGVLHDPVTSSGDLMSGWGNKLSGDWLFDRDMLPAWPEGQPKPDKDNLDISQMAETNDTYWIGVADITNFIALPLGELASTWPYLMSLQSRMDTLEATLSSEGIGSFDFVTPTLDDVALSLTNKLRTLNITTMIQGTAREPATFVRVNWYWLIFPVTVVALSVIFLAIIMIFTDETGGVLWKTSLLPFLFYDFQNQEQRPTGVELTAMRHAAANTMATLQRDEDGDVAFASKASDTGQDSKG